MTDSSNDNKTPKSPSLSEDELESVFKEWDAAKSAFDDAVALDDSNISDEERMLDHERKRSPAAILARSRATVRNRLILLVILSIVGVTTFLVNWSDFSYFFLDENDAVETGDVRQRWISGQRPGDGTFPTLSHNSWFIFSNLIPTEERESESGTYFFFEPILKAIVVTNRSLPEKNVRSVNMHSGLVDLIHKRWIYPGDITASFSGQGRLLKASNAPRRYRSIVRTFTNELLLSERLKDSELWLVIDGTRPNSHGVYVIMYAVTLILIIVSGWFYYRARKRYLALRKDTQI